MLISLSSFGGIAFSTSSYSVHTITLFNVSSLSQYGWILWICFVLFLLATFYIALRETARNMYDPYYAGWQHAWKAPVAAMVFWLAAEFLFTYFAAGYASSSMSMTTPMWYFLVAGIWAFLIEVAAMTFGPTLVASLPGMWRIVVGGTVQQTPQNVVDYVKSCDPSYGMKKTSATASGTTATATMPTASAAAQPANPTTPAAPAASVPQPATPLRRCPLLPLLPLLPQRLFHRPFHNRSPRRPCPIRQRATRQRVRCRCRNRQQARLLCRSQLRGRSAARPKN